jgi:hypothetical protein
MVTISKSEAGAATQQMATAECSKQSTNFGAKAVVMACSPESRPKESTEH